MDVPESWVADVVELCGTAGMPSWLRGGLSTSLEPPGVNISYRLVSGDRVAEGLPWLNSAYRSAIPELAKSQLGCPYYPSMDVRSGVNINILEQRGGRYEMHLDSNPLTALLFVTSHQAEDGGQLLFRTEGGDLLVEPRSGDLLLFDARRTPHAVLPIKTDRIRITVVMNFYLDAECQDRPDGLDDYLYQ
ncbi:2OG-Fe(II) oxygenase [Dactylosporangium sp. NPDC000244]|uniref:2OG-Fe(II) oxygenase family protein n=1 Tax=Dactylosporangium sp. NPDC000244 TaxID=3154365 RepID=UPI0033192DE7